MLVYPWADPPPAGHAITVAPDALWIRMPMPMALDHINVWAIRDQHNVTRSASWTVVDTGLNTTDTTDAWERLLSSSGPLAGAPVTRVVVTHMHPDHIGLAGWFRRKFGARLWITRSEYLSCCVMSGYTGKEAPKDGIEFYRSAGWSAEDLAGYGKRFGSFGRMISALPDSYRRLADGESIQIGQHSWRVVVGNGHSPEHACLYCPALKLFVSGDQVLPRISSNVSVYPIEPDADPIGDWLKSIEKIKRHVPDDVLVLPAHNLPFRGLHERLDALAESTQRALSRLRSSLTQPKRVVDVFEALFSRPVSNAQLLSLATGESRAHINHLMRCGEVSISHIVNGVVWYRGDESRLCDSHTSFP